MRRAAHVQRIFFVLEDVRLSLKRQTEALDAGGDEADYDPDLKALPLALPAM